MLLVVGIVAAVVIAAIAVIAIVDPFGPDYPSEWDARAAGFTAFVERTAGHRYEHPVEVRFLTDEDFVDLVASDPDELTDDDRQAYADTEAQGRALGLFSGATDLYAEQETLNTEGILAFYSPGNHQVVVRLPKGTQPDDVTTGDDLPVDVQVTLVHELTHVLQDQVYDLGGIQDRAETDEQYSAVLGLIEGHAEWVAQRFVNEELTPEQQDEYNGAQESQSGEYEEATSDVSPVLSAAQSAPYVLGPPFVAALNEQGGIPAIDAAFDDPPTTERELMQPLVFLDRQQAPELDDLEAPEGADVLDDGTLGATTTYFLLALGLTPPQALQAVDVAAADRFVAYSVDDRVCVDIAVAAADGADADLLEPGFRAWVDSRPDAADATSERDGTTLHLHACDPGPDVDQDVPGDDAISQLFGRSADLGFLIEQYGYTTEEAVCLTNGLYHEFTIDDIIASGDDVNARIDELTDSCS